MRLPPQKWKLLLVCRLTIHGCPHLGASVPPTIFVDASPLQTGTWRGGAVVENVVMVVVVVLVGVAEIGIPVVEVGLLESMHIFQPLRSTE